MDLQDIDLFSSSFSFTVGKSNRQSKKGTIQGVILSIIVFIFAIAYFSYLLYQFVNNQIDPNYKSQSFITEERIDINLGSDLLGFRFEYDTNQDIQNLQASQNQTYLVFYAYFYYINGTSLTQTQLNIIQCTNPQLAGFYCLDFSPVQNYTLTLSTKENLQSQVFIYTYGCLDIDFNKNSIPSNCANQTEINKIVNGVNAGFRFKLFTSQFNTQTKQIQVNYRNDFVYALGNYISYTTLKAQKQITSVKQGFFIQSQSNYSSPIAYEKDNQLWDRQYTINSINQSGYGMLELIMNEIVQQVEIQYPTIPSILALNKIWTLVKDQHNYSSNNNLCYNKKNKKKFFKKQEIANSDIKLNHNEKLQSILFRFRFFDKKEYLLSKGLDYQQKKIIEKQLSKDLNIFEFYKDILFLKKAVMILLSSEQLAAIKIIGCSSNFLEQPKTLINKDNFLNNTGSLNYFQEQYNLFESENLQFEKIEQFIKRCQQNTSLTEIDKRLLSSICI
ncbi:AMP-binding enzyme family protein (macronuclear) [Tetrahymena thermophila SB210]|uniref:AMP-binding enzyme family protein n=1 Tax=Tetrahymena thermophila (strain SB210) TaxID=312017 RepID=W7XJG7_TETTS|nr:AMP-binding enzyme family protein [Tetrahymena thermophila SB210]EWS75506.1 AMP-binding enzyme family protein [Tetrahymena thermophila SB210]|eukprot:XP_012651975.1 AMP-binding enzyme family protein [Tetrahymena thermophila SB210]